MRSEPASGSESCLVHHLEKAALLPQWLELHVKLETGVAPQPVNDASYPSTFVDLVLGAEAVGL